ncbi:MAG: PD-(D/E)XK nuclease family protein, partial [Bacillota bacterium]|nr:PD-(D/E)XK nuclease family protein [Bacillota bacterium]
AKILLKCKRTGEDIPANWKAAAAALKRKDAQRYDALLKGLLYKNKEIKLSKKETREILDAKSCSPSRIEKYINCPFAYFIQYGLKAEEPVDFSISPLDSGNIYHQILDRLSRYLSSDGKPARDKDSLWQRLPDSEIESFVIKTAEEIKNEDPRGLYTKGFEEEYRSGRIAKTAVSLAQHMVSQVRQGNIDKIYTEQNFKFDFAGIQIHGKIDRLDSTKLEDGEYIKIVDYKTSTATSFNKDLIEKGKAVQLMLYLEAAMANAETGGASTQAKPVGIFYFTIEKDQTESLLEELDIVSDAMAEKIAKEYKLDGAYSTNEKAFATLDKDAKALQSNKSAVLTMSPARGLSEEDFANLRQTFKENFARSVAKLQMGDVSVKPSRYKESSACKFCKFNSICKFDLQIEGCKYD